MWDRLVGVTLPDGGAVAYTYDVFGRRIAKTVPDALGPKTTRYIYDGPDILAETDGDGALLARYTHGQGIDEPLALERYGADAAAGAGTAYYYHTDHLGSVVALTTASGALAETFEYDSYGRRLSGGAVDQPYGFTAREYDAETSLYYYRARHFDPAMGRFLQEDPLHFAAEDFNLYRYVWNDPLHWTDPSGMVAANSYGQLASRTVVRSAGALARVADRLNCVFSIVTVALGGDPVAAVADCALPGKPKNRPTGPNGGGGGGGGGGGNPPQNKKNNGCNSFDGDTLVLTKERYKPISELVP